MYSRKKAKVESEDIVAKKKSLERLEEKLKKALLQVEATRRISIREEISRKKRLELVEQQRLSALARDERHRKQMWEEVDRTLQREVRIKLISFLFS